MPSKPDFTGKKFKSATVICDSGKRDKSGLVLWKCRCNCGKIVFKRTSALRIELAGCTLCARGTHKKSGTKIYRCWRAMLDRCKREKNQSFFRYGGRGIFVCKRWHSFNNFLLDMGEPGQGQSIERINNNKGYNKKNCKWATPKEQTNNRGNSRFLVFKNEKLTVSQWAEKVRIRHQTLHERLKKGWSVEKTLTTPIDKRFSEMSKLKFV